MMQDTLVHDPTAEQILEHLSDTEKCQDTLTPYKEFVQDGKIYYFTPGGFLYRKDQGTEEVGGFFCGYLSDEVWHSRTEAG